MTDTGATVAVVLAAGDAVRFGGIKVVAELGGRPLLQRVLDAVDAAGIERVVVVLGRTAADVESRIRWRSELRVVNPTPERGLSSSVRIGIEAAAALDPVPEAALVLLGDQPLVRANVMRGLIDAASTACPIVVPAYAGGGGANPVLLRREAWSLVEGLSGDRGFGPLIAQRPDLVQTVVVGGDNPDVDEQSDLEQLARSVRQEVRQ